MSQKLIKEMLLRNVKIQKKKDAHIDGDRKRDIFSVKTISRIPMSN